MVVERSSVAPATEISSGPRPTIEALTGVRAVAAIWVVLFHLRATIPTLLPEARSAQFVLDSGFLGVDVFFVLSGFVISYNYADRLFRLDGREYRRFLVARLARVYPAHVFALALTATVLGWAALKTGRWDATYSATDFVANLLMLQALPGVVSWNVPAWSVSCELAAYLAFPVVAALVLRSGSRIAVLTASAATVLLATSAIALGWSPSTEVAMYWVRIATGFTAGCLLWRFWSRAVRPGPAWDIVLAAAFGGGATVLLLVDGPASFLTAPFIALFVLATASATGAGRSVLASRPLQWGGRISYSLYLVHMPVFYALVILHPPVLFATRRLVVRLAALLGYVGVMVVAATLTYYLVEEPARRAWKRRGLRSQRHADDPAS